MARGVRTSLWSLHNHVSPTGGVALSIRSNHVSTTTTTLDLAALDGLLLDANNYAFADSSQVSVNSIQDSFTVNGGETPSAVAVESLPVDGTQPTQFHVAPTSARILTSLPDGSSTNEAIFQIGFTQNGHTVGFSSGQLYAVVGWNADSVLLEEWFPGIPTDAQQYLIISDQALTDGKVASGSNSYTLASSATPTIDNVKLSVTDDPTVTCFAAGTRIATPSGAMAVEDLAEGDLVCTLSGAVQPVTWIGQRRFDCTAYPQPGRVMPVRVARGAFGPGLPVRELVLSPEHALFLGGALVPVHCLVNGRTIRQAAVTNVTYFHLELPRHDVVLAEGLPAETYLDTGNRQSLIRRDAGLAQAA